MDITAPNDAPGSCIDRQSHKVPPAAAFARDHPVTPSHGGMSDAGNSVSLGYSHGLRTADAM